MKDNFDLRTYLTENKMTENSRGDVRHHLGETKLDTRLFNAGHKHILDEELGLDECGDFEGDVSLDEANHTSKQAAIDYLNQQFQNAGLTTYASMGRVFGPGDKAVTVFSCKEEQNDPVIAQAMAYVKDTMGQHVQGFSVGSKSDLEQWKASREQQSPDDSVDPVDECGDNMILGRDGNFGLEEAGYDLSDDDDDDLAGVPDLADIIGNDPSASRAAKAAQRDIDRDVRAAEKDDAAAAAADAPAGPEDSADDPGSVPDAPADDAPADYQPGISANLKYNPEFVQFEMSPEELDQYLGSFRRPEAALRYLNQKLKVFQQEVNDGTRQKAYMYLRNGDSSYQWSYTRPTMDQGEVIATIYKDPNYKGWED